MTSKKGPGRPKLHPLKLRSAPVSFKMRQRLRNLLDSIVEEDDNFRSRADFIEHCVKTWKRGLSNRSEWATAHEMEVCRKRLENAHFIPFINNQQWQKDCQSDNYELLKAALNNVGLYCIGWHNQSQYLSLLDPRALAGSPMNPNLIIAQRHGSGVNNWQGTETDLIKMIAKLRNNPK